MTLDFPEFVFGWFYHDDEKEKYIVDKKAPKEVKDYFKEIDDEYFEIYKIHIADFGGDVVGYDSSIWSKVKDWLAFDSFKNHHGRVGRVGGSLPKNITEQEINRLTQNAPSEWGEAFVEYTQRPADAIEKLLKEKRGYVPEAIYKNGVGLIDFVWGVAGEKGTDEGFGISHIIRRRTEHMRDGIQFVRDLPSLIKNGKFYKPKGSNRIFIETKDKKSVISLDWQGDSKVWLLTAYFKDENKMG